MLDLWGWWLLAFLLALSDAQQLDGPIIMAQKEILLQKGANFSIHCKGKRPLEFYAQEGAYEDDGNFKKIPRNVAPSDNDYQHEIALDLYNVDRFAVGYYACHDDQINVSQIFSNLITEPINTNHISYTYVYVNDSENLIAPMREFVFVTKLGSKTVIECKPTYPDIQVNLSMEFIMSEYNPKIGYILDSTDYSEIEPMTELICEFGRNGLRNETKVYLDISGEIKSKQEIRHSKSKQDWLYIKQAATSDSERPQIFPKKQYFLRNESIFLNCTVSYAANLPAMLTWKIPRNTSEVKVFSNEMAIQDAVLLYKAIRINNANANDDGMYTCEAKKGQGGVPSTDSLSIRYLEKPFLEVNIIKPDKRTPVPTAMFKFGFNIDGYPIPKYKYIKDHDTIIVNGSKYIYDEGRILNFPKLILHDMNINDTGNYTIEATNSYETKRATYQLYVQDVPRITFDLSEGRKTKNTRVRLVCEVTGYPLPDVTWTFIDDENNSVNEAGKTKQISVYKVVSTLDLAVERSGTIMCKASNKVKDILYNKNLSRYLLVDEIHGGFGIENGNKTSMEVSEGKSLTLRCLASTYDYTSVHWQTPNNDVPVSDSNNSMSLITTLKIDNLSVSHTGNYTCVGNKNGTEQEQMVYIKVAGIRQPQIKVPVQDTEREVIRLQDVVTLTCLAEAIPPPEITWYKDGEMVNDKVTKVFLNYSTVNSSYTFVQNTTDSVDYECVAKSGRNEDRRTYRVTYKLVTEFKAEYLGIIGVIIFALILLILYLIWKIKKEKKFRKELAAAGLLYFKEGAPRSLNPELGIDEQAELLPYDDKFEFPVEKLILGPQLGAGAFGVVYKAEARGIINAEDSTTVAVKMVKKTADNIYIKALASELKIMVHLGKHINIVNLLGACTKNVGKRELIVIVEFCKFGNIHNYMQRHREVFIDQLTDNKEKALGNVNRAFSCSGGDSGMTSDCLNTNQTQQTDHTFLNTAASNRSGRLVSETGYVQPDWRSNYESDYVYEGRKPRPLTSRDLLAWAFQIARGMEYLSSMKILHGDLAARNILLAEDNVVKICDFGLARSIYKNDEYQKKENSPLPVKWLAIECMTDRIFSTQSDVWSFGIVLWELFSLAKTPYPEISPQDLLQQLQAGHRLSKPMYADDRLYRVMRSCWEQRPPKRPTFTELQETLGSFLEDNVRNHYVELNQSCADKNANRVGENYLVQVCAPDYNNQVTPSPHHYANDATGFFFGITPTPTTNQLQHDDEGYLAMTPASNQPFSPRIGSAFDFDARNLNGRGSAASQGSELTPMLTLNHLPARSGSESDHEGNAPYLNMHPRIDEETDEVFEIETKMNNLKNSQNNAVTNPTYITFPTLDEKKPIIANNYVNVNGNGLIK